LRRRDVDPPVGRRGGPKKQARKSFKKLKRRREVSRLYSEEVPQNEIAKQLGVNQSTISRDLKFEANVLRAQSAEFLRALRDKQLRELEWAAAENKAAWMKSKDDFTRSKQSSKIDNDGKRMGPVEAEMVREGQTGDPRHMANFLASLKAIADLTGLHVQAGPEVPIEPGDTLIVRMRHGRPLELPSAPQ